jgi:hypothetical protein
VFFQSAHDVAQRFLAVDLVVVDDVLGHLG